MKKALALSMALILVTTVAYAQQPDAGKRPGKKDAAVRRQPPSHPDVKYGPYARNVMDVWLAKSEKPTPVLVSIPETVF